MDAPAAQTPAVPPAPPAPAAAPPVAHAPSHAGYGYGSPYGAPAGWAPAPPRQNVLAWVAFALAFGGLMLGPLSSIAGVVCGHIARRQIRERGEQGDTAALTGLIAGYIVTALWVVGIVLYVLFIVAIIAFSATAAGVSAMP
ncbi:DUF4190 domain-containing protein [Agromyces sp. C10]|uniref:DUF4190 domain-containing protein n=1 Tax=Agromyces sp. C10 TaxID=2935077 RepID=UPI00200B40BB|nr:DUF4190 domain-containing protein [Agromyces sp. C10]MCK8608359.1 DUF4190 domain-containing protein [Agromyces sp. C10]